MAFNITVNGKVTKHCIDVESSRKQMEKERRKMRLLQVRAESKNLAKKIRDDVNEEKERQLHNLNTIKAQEYNFWREHMLAHKNHDYRTAIFQVGTAHAAARAENESRTLREQQQASQSKNYKTLRHNFKKCHKHTNEKSNKHNLKSDNNFSKNKNETHHVANKCQKSIQKENSFNCSCYNSSSDSKSENETDQMDLSTELTSSLLEHTSSSSINEEEITTAKATQTTIRDTTVLQKTPAVILDVECESGDSVLCEVKDNHVENNRQFNCVIRRSPPGKEQQKPCSAASNTTKSKEGSSNKNKSRLSRRFTQVTDLLHGKNNYQSKSRSKTPPKSRSTSAEAPPSVPHPTPTILTPQKSHPKSSTSAKSSTKSGREATLSNATTVTISKSRTCDAAPESTSSTSGRVQFYDYNNKFSKDYAHPNEAIHATSGSIGENAQPNAKEQASIEKQLQESRQQENEKLRRKCEERGQRALEREQIRRDCSELTEKLEVLTRQHPQLMPTDAHLHARHHYEDNSERKEVKMNSIVEQMLMRPAIITCQELDNETCLSKNKNRSSKFCKPSISNELNLGSSQSNEETESIPLSSDSCCSILLGYVNDETKKIRKELTQCDTRKDSNHEKVEKLKNLLKRIEQLRSALQQELEKGSNLEHNENVQQVIGSIGNLRKERENILINDLTGQPSGVSIGNEPLIEQKIREVFNEQQRKATLNQDIPAKQIKRTMSQVTTVNHSNTDRPLEIIINVKGCTRTCSGSTKTINKLKFKSTKSPLKLSTLARSPSTKPKRKANSLQQKFLFDSNSTSYRSLPPVSSDDVNGDTKEPTNKNDTDSFHNVNPSRISHTTRLNPLIANYVHRLLGMSRNSITALGVSSSDIETPSSSILNAPSNKITFSSKEIDAGLELSQARLERVQKFVDDNRSFINELEESLQTQSNISLETSMRAFEEIRKQRLCGKQSKTTLPNKDSELVDNVSNNEIKTQEVVKQKNEEIINPPKQGYAHSKPVKKIPTITSKNLPVHLSSQKRQISSVSLSKSNDVLSTAVEDQTSKNRSPASIDSKQQHTTSKNIYRQDVKKTTLSEKSVRDEEHSKADATEDQIERYAQLTSNCTQRIAELTELINKVRVEKQRLLEITLSSVSESGRNSTEYTELPNILSKPDNTTNTNNSDDARGDSSQSKLLNSSLINELVTSSMENLPPENQPLEKNRHIGASRDSGISLSRPITAQDADPLSFSSSTQTYSNSQRKAAAHPPPTLRRFSPQLLEDKLAHELSTILEVETPGSSRILNGITNNNNTNQSASVTTATTTMNGDSNEQRRIPLSFPTFEQYMQQINLDMTQIDPEQSIRIRQEFNALIVAIKEAEANRALNYVEFPSLASYMQNLTDSCGIINIDENNKQQTRNNDSPESIEDFLACMRIANLTVRSFPTQKEYMNRLTTNTPEEDLKTVTTESLENLSGDRNSTDTTESINIEDELKRRNILKNSFRSAKTVTQDTFFAAAARTHSATANVKSHIIATESGIEKLSTSDNLSDDLERDLHELGINWPTTMRNKKKESEALSTTSSNSMHNRSRNADSNFHELGRPLNLREFLTKELLKHANTSGTSSSTDDSLRSQFFHSIIDSLTPTGGTQRTNVIGSNGCTGGGTSNNLDRQKTSTPVVSHSTQSHSIHSSGNASSTSTTQLFSGESRISSVHFQDNYSSIHYGYTRNTKIKNAEKNSNNSDEQR